MPITMAETTMQWRPVKIRQWAWALVALASKHPVHLQSNVSLHPLRNPNHVCEWAPSHTTQLHAQFIYFIFSLCFFFFFFILYAFAPSSACQVDMNSVFDSIRLLIRYSFLQWQKLQSVQLRHQRLVYHQQPPTNRVETRARQRTMFNRPKSMICPIR